MYRKIYSEIITSCIQGVGEQISQLNSMIQSLTRAMSDNNADAFADSYIQSQYSSIRESLCQKRDELIEHEIILGKKRAYLEQDDTVNAQKLRELIDGISDKEFAVNDFAIDAYNSAAGLAQDDASIYDIIGEDEFNATLYIRDQLGNEGIDYDDFDNMTYKEKLLYQQKCIQYAKQYFLDTGIELPDNGRIDLPISPGVNIYYRNEVYTTIGNNRVSVDYSLEDKATCVHLLATYDFMSLDMAAARDEVSATYSYNIDENTSAFSTVKIDKLGMSYSIENGITTSYNYAEVNGAYDSVSVDNACGVEIYSVSNWEPQEETASSFSLGGVLAEISGIAVCAVGAAAIIALIVLEPEVGIPALAAGMKFMETAY